MKKTLAWFLGSTILGASLSALPPTALAADDELASVEDLSFVPELFVVSGQQKKACNQVPSICFYADGGGTVAGVDVDATLGTVTTLARGTQVAGLSKENRIPEATAWHVEMVARFGLRTSDAPIVVAVMDYADPEGMARKEATTVWQLNSPPTKELGMHLVLSAEDGFLARHTYLVRIVQGIGANERVLAEGNVLLE